jgi:hypothetical protein
MSQYFPWTFMFWDGQELPGDKAAVITVTCCTGSKGYISGNKTNDIHKSKVIFKIFAILVAKDTFLVIKLMI